MVVAVGLVLIGCAPSTTQVPLLADAVSPSPGVISAGRLTHEDIGRLKDAGIEHVIDLTPDDETPDFDEANVVRSAGIDYSNLPISGAADLTRENVIAFDQLLRDAERPVLVHCASGNRVGAMAALRAAWVESRSEEDAIAIGKSWGLKGLEPQVRERIDSIPADRSQRDLDHGRSPSTELR
jgi:uncharacterized protein (TIGR01244 family)